MSEPPWWFSLLQLSYVHCTGPGCLVYRTLWQIWLQFWNLWRKTMCYCNRWQCFKGVVIYLIYHCSSTSLVSTLHHASSSLSFCFCIDPYSVSCIHKLGSYVITQLINAVKLIVVTTACQTQNVIGKTALDLYNIRLHPACSWYTFELKSWNGLDSRVQMDIHIWINSFELSQISEKINYVVTAFIDPARSVNVPLVYVWLDSLCVRDLGARANPLSSEMVTSMSSVPLPTLPTTYGMVIDWLT